MVAGVWNDFRIFIALTFGVSHTVWGDSETVEQHNWPTRALRARAPMFCHFVISDHRIWNIRMWFKSCAGGLLCVESLLLLASVSGNSDSVAALNVSVVGYSSWILSKTKQSDFSMQLSLMELLMVLVWKWLFSNQGCHFGRRPNRRLNNQHWWIVFVGGWTGS